MFRHAAWQLPSCRGAAGLGGRRGLFADVAAADHLSETWMSLVFDEDEDAGQIACAGSSD